MKRLVFFLMLVLLGGFAYSQTSSCKDSIIYHTSDFGDGSSSLLVPLRFMFFKDSIHVRSGDPKVMSSIFDLSFKIVEKSCQWDQAFSNGSSLYRVVLNDSTNRKAVVNIKIRDKKGSIKLLYDDNEPRIFTVGSYDLGN